MIKDMELLFLHSADEIDMGKVNGFVVYIGTHGDAGAHRADVILPGSAYTEKSAIYVNTEGRPQMTARAAFAPGDAREDWAILRALSEVLGKTLPFDSLVALRGHLYQEYPYLALLDSIAEPGIASKDAFFNQLSSGRSGKLSATAFACPIKDYFLTNPIARASRVMAECSQMRAGALKQAAE